MNSKDFLTLDTSDKPFSSSVPSHANSMKLRRVPFTSQPADDAFPS